MGQQFQSLSDEESSASSGFMRRKARAIVGSAVLRIVKVHQWIGSEDIRGGTKTAALASVGAAVAGRDSVQWKGSPGTPEV